MSIFIDIIMIISIIGIILHIFIYLLNFTTGLAMDNTSNKQSVMHRQANGYANGRGRTLANAF